MKVYIIKNGKYVFDFAEESFVKETTETCLLPTQKLAEVIIDNLFDGDGEVEEIDFVCLKDRRKSYHEGYQQGRFDERMENNYGQNY